MVKIKAGDKVKVIAPKDWPEPPGFRMANAEGTVENWMDWPEVMGYFTEYIYVKIDKADIGGKDYIGTYMHFKEDYLQKI